MMNGDKPVAFVSPKPLEATILLRPDRSVYLRTPWHIVFELPDSSARRIMSAMDDRIKILSSMADQLDAVPEPAVETMRDLIVNQKKSASPFQTIIGEA